MNYALVTGGSRGLGAAICKRLAQQGLGIIINYRSNESAAKAVADEIVGNGGCVSLLPFDVSSEESVDAALEKWEEEHPDDRITVLVNNAGIREDNLLVFMQTNQWHKVINTTLDGFFYVTRRVLKGMLTKRFGRIINIASLSGLKGLPGQANYSAAKAALIGATKALAQEVAARKVTVNAVAPGFIKSDMTKDLDEDGLKKLVPLGRFGEADEVAALVAFLASKDSSYITGETISINGGLC
ncbi:3-oxoacyl-ACP reductase FabG [Bacteroides acidifaciens]|uniref:3-oxoacyl-ACP reductase FabG n=1 Tax=Bacteroides acidifaciens TaxID=85831 RepID=UPI0025582A78|nr:3-oxoacyl-ACP reductase FabG [Bacteroides acidifaciens]